MGLLQGITELFPVSSLGHSIILPGILRWNLNQNANYFLLFLVATHFATALVLFLFFWKDWKKIIIEMLKSLKERKIKSADAKLGWLLVVGTIPAGLVGLLFQDKIKMLFASPIYVAFFLVLNGAMLFLAELLRKKASKKVSNKLSWWQSIKVGFMQVLALIPGFSRTGSTITGGLLVGLSHEDALRYSFLLATPIIGAAAVLKLPELFTSGNSIEIKTALVGAVAAAIGAYFSVKFLSKYFKTNNLTPFAVYCVAAGIISIIILLAPSFL